MLNLKTILVPVDFSEPSAEALRRALELADLTKATVQLLHVGDTRYAQLGYGLAVYGSEEDLTRLMKIASERMQKMRTSFGVSEAKLPGKVVAGVPYQEILEEVTRSKPDLLVMGIHGRTGMDRVIVGSQCELVVRQCPIPVLVVHGPETTTH